METPEIDVSAKVAEIVAGRVKNPLSEIYDEYLWAKRQWEKVNEIRSRDFLHASDLSGCMRALVLSHFGADAATKEQVRGTLRRFENGKFFHKRMQEAFTAAGVIRDCERLSLNEEYRVGGYIDGIVDVGYGTEIAEFKSANQFMLKKGAELPFKDHKLQATAYMLTEGIYRTRFFYECKNTNVPYEIAYRMEESKLAEILSRSVTAWKYIEQVLAEGLRNETLPPAPCILPAQPEAAYCMCRNGCFSLIGDFRL